MAKRNYNKISTKPKVEKAQTVVSEEDKQLEPEKQETPQPKVLPIGVVTKCAKLNIRTKPSIESKVVCEVPIASELMIDLDNSTDDWFKVCTAAGTEGFCMKKFVAVEQ